MRHEIDLKSISTIVLICLIGFLTINMFSSMVRFSNNAAYREVENIKDIVRKAAVQCYALEGSYPSTLEYLEEYYGVLLDHENYNYFYETFASNILPDIVVTFKDYNKAVAGGESE